MSKDPKQGDEVTWGTSQGKIKGHVAKASKEAPQYVVKSKKTGAKAVHKPENLKKT